jgi:hypothetical protein
MKKDFIAMPIKVAGEHFIKSELTVTGSDFICALLKKYMQKEKYPRVKN